MAPLHSNRCDPNVSLFRHLMSSFGDCFDSFGCSQATLIQISHTVETFLVRERLPGVLLLGFQESRQWRADGERYRALADSAQVVGIFAGDMPGPDAHEREMRVNLASDDPLRQERFVCALTPQLSFVLCAQQEATGQFNTFWTFEPEIVVGALDLLEGVVKRYRPERLADIQRARVQIPTTQPNARLIAKLLRELVLFEDTLQRTLREHETRYNVISHVATDAIYTLQITSEQYIAVDWATSDFARLLAQNLAALSTGAEPSPLFHPDDVSSVVTHMKTLLEGREATSEFRICPQPGEVRWLRNDARPICDHSSGRVLGIAGAASDRTAQKQDEAALRQSEQRLHVLEENLLIVTETAGIGLALVDTEHRYRYTNETYKGYLRKSGETLTGRLVADVLGPLYHDLLRQRLERALRGEYVNEFLDVPIAPGVERHYTAQLKLGAYQGEPVAVVVLNDITEIRRAEEQLRYLARLLNQVSDAIISTDLSFTIMSWNAAAEALYGWSAHETVGQPLGTIVPTFYPDNNAQHIRAQFLNEGRWRGEVSQQRRDGSQLIILSSVSLVNDHAGTPIGAVAVNRDITERKRAEQALQRSNQRLQVLSDASRMFAELGSDYQALLAQVAQHTAETLRASCTIRSLSDDAQWLDVIALGHVDPTLLKAMQALIQPERMPIDDRQPAAVAARSGQSLLIPAVDSAALPAIIPASQQPLLAIMAPHTILALPLRVHGRTIGCLTFARSAHDQPPFDEDDLTLAQDLADRAALAITDARLLQQVQRSANRLEHLRAIDQAIITERPLSEIAEAAAIHIGQLIPTVRVGVMLLNADETFTSLALLGNGTLQPPPAARLPLMILGVALGSLLQGQMYNVSDVAALPEVPALIQANQDTRIRSFFQIPIMAEGTLIALLNVGADQPDMFSDEHFEIAREVANQLSIAIQQAHLRKEIERYAHELEDRVAARTAELIDANKELEAFSYSISHDLRAPLRSIDGFSRILLEDYAQDIPAEAQRYFNLVRDNAQRMGVLINDLLAFSRLGRQPLTMRTVNVALLVRQCFNELRDEQAGRQIELTIGDLPDCQGDVMLLKQVWTNLIANALKYTRRRDPAVIAIGRHEENGITVYWIKDNGAGFDMRYADKLFGVFQRLHRAEEYEGTGVGLAIVQRIVHRHGGRIWADAAVDQGATFYVTLEGGHS